MIIFIYLLTNVRSEIYRMERLYLMGPLLFHLMDYFHLYFEKVTAAFMELMH